MTQPSRQSVSSNEAFDLLKSVLKSDSHSYTIKLAGKTFEFTTVQNIVQYASDRNIDLQMSKGWLGRTLHSVISEETDYHIGSISQEGRNVTAYFRVS